MTNLVVNCKGTIVSSNFFRQIMNNQMGLSKGGRKAAERLLWLAGALPDAKAGTLLALAQGQLEWQVDDEADTFTIVMP